VSMTNYRDEWIANKRVDTMAMAQILQATRPATEQLRAAALQIVEIAQELVRASTFRDFYDATERSAEASRRISYLTHNLRLFCDLQVPPSAVYTDHFINQFFLMSAYKRTWWVEGPAFCGLAIEPGARILELGCGTGYYTDIFFSPFASEIVAIDIDPRAIEFARRFHQTKNIRYAVVDFRKELPEGPFDVVIWSPTIIAYTPEEVDVFMARLSTILAKNARLCGFTAVEAEGPSDDVLWHDLRSLGARIKKYFANVRVFERNHVTIQPHRHELYFYASDGPLPFDSEWTHGLRL
jgi:SAM-dependent methyltransferase